MKQILDYKELIDLEYFLHQDQSLSDHLKHERDRKIYLDQKNENAAPGMESTISLLRGWIRKRAEQNFPAAHQRSPGTVFTDLKKLLNTVLFVKGCLLGLLTGVLFFTYTGTEPVNVFHFLLFFVFSQLLLIILLSGSLLLRKSIPSLPIPSFYSFVFHKAYSRLANRLNQRLMQQMGSEKKHLIDYGFHLAKMQSDTYRSIFYWPVFLLFQLFGIGFNLGLLCMTLLKISTSDLAFGWQSTIQLSSTTIHAITRMLALPWRYLVPADIAYPSLEEIEGSRIILKEGIYHLSTLDLIAWWPFLVLCLLLYGLLFRLFSFSIGKIMANYSLKRLKLDSASITSLLRRMTTPLMTSQAEPELAVTDQPDSHIHPGSLESLRDSSEREEKVPLILLMPDDIYDQCQHSALGQLLLTKGFSIRKIFRFLEDYDQDQHLLETLQGESWSEECELLIVMEGWMVPLVSFISYLRELRKILPPGRLIHTCLIGRPDGEMLTGVREEDYTIWKRKLAATGDRHLHIFSLIPTNRTT